MEVSGSDSNTESSYDSTSSSFNDSSNSNSGESVCEEVHVERNSSRGIRQNLASAFACSRTRTAHVGKVLKVLRKNGIGDIPTSYSTLMGTPKYKISEREVGPGKYFHYGIEKNLLKMESFQHFWTFGWNCNRRWNRWCVSFSWFLKTKPLADYGRNR